MIDIANQLQAIHRAVDRHEDDSGEVVGVRLQRTYDTSAEDVWSALTDPDRVKRWFYPVSGDLRAGGSFQLEGNASGDIVECDPPRLLRVTFGGPTSLVELRLSADGDTATVVELEHTVPIEIAQSGAGALYVAPGWDGAFLALDLFLTGDGADDPDDADDAARMLAEWEDAAEVIEFSRQSVHAWTTTVESSGTASSDEIAAAEQVSLAQFAPESDVDQQG